VIGVNTRRTQVGMSELGTLKCKKLRMVMDFELLLGGQVGRVKCEQVQNAISQNRLKPIPISWKVSRVGQIWSQI
jgi:hypothetical protein